MKKYTVLFLVFSILVLSGNLCAKKKGADLIVQKTDGIQIRGELIAVKENSLLLLNRLSGTDVTVDVSDIRLIKIMQKSNTLSYGVLGFFVGGMIGYAIGYDQGNKSKIQIISPSYTGLAGAGIGSVLAGLGGVLIGAMVSNSSKTVQFEGKSDSEIQEILNEIRKKARIQNIQ